ncbi:DUF4259 domain-containing protein [Terrabacter sp. NPDC080008]|uniref:DUF4259 domain-containing protein n=1 Tax=Terrabacter sp. NPDC080008 TaxID=3155176 RepID=UPI00344DCD87
MGAWGVGPFENDDAADFVDELVRGSVTEAHQRVEWALRVPSGRIEYPRGATAIAAAALVDTCIDDARELEPELRDFAGRLRIDLSDEVVRSAYASLIRVEQGDSEWNELWLDVETWAAARQVLRDIRTRVAADPRVSGVSLGQNTLF